MAMKIIKKHVRSTSLPSRSHPSTAAIEEVIEKLLITMNTTPMTSSESVYSGLEGLEDLYECTDEFLKMGSTQRVLSFNDEKKKMKAEFMEEMLEDSLILMDTCNVTRDLMVETHDHVRALKSCVRRKNNVEFVSGYVGFRKSMKKEVKKLIGSLKNVNVRLVMRGLHVCDQERDVHLLAVVHALRRVVSMTVSVLKSFLEFLSGRNGNDNMKRKLVSVLMSKKFHDHKMVRNHLEDVDSAICGDFRSQDAHLHVKLEEVEVWIGKFEKNLERLFRGLIKTRTSLLNIISQ